MKENRKIVTQRNTEENQKYCTQREKKREQDTTRNGE